MSELATAVEAAETGTRVRLEPARMAEHGARLFRAAYALCGSRHDAEDLVQDTFERALRQPRFIRRDRDLPYLLSVLRRTWSAQAATAARRCTHPAPPEDFEWLPDEGPGQQAALEARLAYAAMADLSEPLRMTIVAVDVVGLSYKEAARALKTRKGTIMSRLFRAREQLASALEPA
ncbi:MAG TPA: RNA polymerase sigma factor [Solirubrobacter sp.]|nr:RNA polymerase sigma factor [Solirubrobacter sp.]